MAAASSSTPLRRMAVSVFGKQLILSLESNTQLIDPSIDGTNGRVMLRGTLEGVPASWVRLTRVASGTYGLIWDGTELYAIEPAAAIKATLANSLPVPSSDTVIFKLSDTTVDLGGDYCGSTANEGTVTADTGLATYRALTADLAQQGSYTDHPPTLRLEMQVLADAAFRTQFTSDQAALDAIMVRLNNVDGIYSSQVGLDVQATDIQVFAQDPGALSTSTNADTLLVSLGQLRAHTPSMTTYAATHLFTGRDLDGDTLGIAYIGNICGARYATSLSETRNRGAWIDSLVTAHELGHQLGAVHDGTGACGGTASEGYLMSAFINGSDGLSQCSRDTIVATMQSAACLVPVGTPDIALVVANATLSVKPDTSLEWMLTIQNVGTDKAAATTVHLDVPMPLLIEASAITGGSCTINHGDSGSTVDCQVGALYTNESRQLGITLRSTQIGDYALTAVATTDHDDNTTNNQAQITVMVSNDAPSANVASNVAAASAAPADQAGGGGAINLGWLLILGTMAGWRARLSCCPGRTT